MDIAPNYFNYESPDVSKGMMYQHPLEDVKQSQLWAMQTKNALEQMPSAIRDYLTFDTFDKDKPRYNEIIDKYKGEIDSLVNNIQSHNDKMTPEDRIALSSLTSRIRTDMATGDLSLMRDNNMVWNLWNERESELGVTEPIKWEKMKEAKKNEFMNNKSRENLVDISSEKFIARPDLNDVNGFINSMILPAFQRTSVSKDGTRTTTYWYDTDEELAEIVNGAIRNIDRGWLGQEYKYVYGIDGIEWKNPVILVEDEKGNKVAVADPNNPYYYETQKIIDEMRARQTNYTPPKVSSSSGRGSSSRSAGSWGNTGVESYTGDVEVFIPKKASWLFGFGSIPENQKNAKDIKKYKSEKRGIDKMAMFNGVEVDGVVNPVISMLSVSPLTGLANSGFADQFDSFMLNPIGDADFIEKAWRERLSAIDKDIRIDWKNIKGGKNKRFDCKFANGRYEVEDKTSGITLFVSESEINQAHDPMTNTLAGNTYTSLSTDMNKIKLNGNEIKKGDAISQIERYRAAYLDVVANYGDRKYNTEMIELTDVSKQKFANVLNKYNQHLVYVSRRGQNDKTQTATTASRNPSGDGETPSDNLRWGSEQNKTIQEEVQDIKDTEKKGNAFARTANQQDYYGFYDEKGTGAKYKILSVEKYCGNIDGVACVFECTVDVGDGKTETQLIGLSDKSSKDYWVQSELKNEFLKTYIADGKTIPDNIYRRMADPSFEEFYDFVNSYFIYDFTDEDQEKFKKSGQTGLNYQDFKIDNGLLEDYLGYPFTGGDKYILRVIRPQNGNQSYLLLERNNNGEYVPAKNLHDTFDDYMPLDIIYDYILANATNRALANNKSFDSKQIDSGISSLTTYIMNYMGVNSANKINANHERYESDLTTGLFVNGYNFFKSHPSSNWSYAIAAYRLYDNSNSDINITDHTSLYNNRNNESVKKYVGFTGITGTSNYRKGGDKARSIHKGHIIWLPNAKVEGVVDTQHMGSSSEAKYVMYNDSKGIRHFIPLDEFLRLDTKCSIGSVKEAAIERMYKQ